MQAIKINALMPMKGNSERVPNKNLRLFNGKPLYHHMVDVLIESKYVDQIFINTDSDKIISDVKEHYPNINIIKRPEELEGDYVSMNKIIEYDLSIIEGDYFLQTHSTNPLLTVSTLDNAIEYFAKNLNTYDSVFSVTKWQTRFYWEDNSPINHDPTKLIRTQDLKPVFEENSNFYLFSKESFKTADSKRIGVTPGMFSVSKVEAMDIDDEEDFKIAEQISKVTRV